MKTYKKYSKNSKNRKRKTKTKRAPRYCYIFGYGSLIHDKDRQHTTIRHYKAIPVILNKEFGYKRYYDYSIIEPPYYRVLEIRKNPANDTPINGVLFKIPISTLKELDEREEGYKRVTIPWKHITNHDTKNKLDKHVKIYTYVGLDKFSNKTSRDKIWHYYLDLTVHGCLSHGEDFAKMFFDTTYALPREYSTFNLWRHNSSPINVVKDKYSFLK